MKEKTLVLGALSVVSLASALPAAAEAAPSPVSGELQLTVDEFGRPSVNGADIGQYLTHDQKLYASAASNKGNCGNCSCVPPAAMV